MMDLTLPLTLLYVTLAFLLMCLCFATPWKLWVKAGMVLAVTCSYFFAQGAFEDMRGWPSAQHPPKKFVLLATVIEEPNKERNTKGAIYIWVNPLEDNKPSQNPRAFQLAYQKELHALLNDSMTKNRQGLSQIGSTEPPSSSGMLGWLKNAADPNAKIRISDAPSPQLPEK
ncbi:MAG: hypothetical protein LW629_01045 [Burkholderiales bacterium]|jgi:hypothetical protein|nr:hypothetical protein [Burkholderiales bacterium]